MLDLFQEKILVTGAHGFLGRHVAANLLRKRNVSKLNLSLPKSSELDLREWSNCQKAVAGQSVVIHLAAHVGGIGLNKEKPGELFYDNALMGIQLMEAARQAGVKKFVIIGTTCAYPEPCPMPLKEENLWAGYPAEVTAPYGLAKKMLLVQAQSYRKQYGFNGIFLLPTNLYGPGDNFSHEHSHVIPALIMKFADAVKNNSSTVTVWGSGKATREFLYADDAAEGIVLAAERYDGSEPVNLGTGTETPIKEIVEFIAEHTGFKGDIVWDASKPDGVLRRCMDVSRAEKEFGFKANTNISNGIKNSINWYNDVRSV